MERAFSSIAEGNATFMDLIKGPNKITREELRRLIAKRPSLWGRYAKFLETL